MRPLKISRSKWFHYYSDQVIISYKVKSTQLETSLYRKRILVAGGAGFIGSHLCRRLVSDGHDVVCIDNYVTGKQASVADLLRSSNFEMKYHDVCIPLHIDVDEIYNLACPASPIHYQHDPIQTTKTSVLGAINILDLAKRTGAKVLQASTSEVYGDPIVHPQPESYWGNVNPIGPRACYDEGKRCAETLFSDYRRLHDTRIKIVRIFNTYGPSMHPDDGRVVSNFIVQALQNHDITLYGDGRQTRAFCYVEDLVEGLVRMMATPDDVTGPINIGNPNEISIVKLAHKVIELIGSTSRIVYKPLPKDDPIQRCPDISLAERFLQGWKPNIALTEGLNRTIAYFDTVLFNRQRPGVELFSTNR